MAVNALSSNEKKLIFRALFLLIVSLISLYDITLLENALIMEVGYFSFYQLLWLFFLLEMLFIFVPRWSSYVGCGKIYAKHYSGTLYNKEALVAYTRKFNKRALMAIVFWMILLSGIGCIYVKGLINKTSLFLLVIFFYFADQFCINVWCPFRSWIVRNKCCNACRIYNWGHFMIFSPLVLIPSFWTWSLVAVSLIILIQWEYQHFRYPERFSEISNLNLRCSHCQSKCKK